MLMIAVSSCKLSEHVDPITPIDHSTVSIVTLKTYLSRNLNISENEVIYNPNLKEFSVGKKGIILKETDIQSAYRIANEYKARYNKTQF